MKIKCYSEESRFIYPESTSFFAVRRAKFVLLVEQRMREPKEESGQATCPSVRPLKTISTALAQPISPISPTSSALPTNVLQQCTRHLRQISRPWFGPPWPMAAAVTTFTGAEDVAPNPLFPLAGLRQSQLQAKSRQKNLLTKTYLASVLGHFSPW